MSGGLSIYVGDEDGMGESERSFSLADGNFVSMNIAVTATGVVMRDNPKMFTVVPEALDLMDFLGKGASSYVQRAVHRPSGTQLALKVISIFDKSKRDQLIKEIQTLYDADCDWCVGGGPRPTRAPRVPAHAHLVTCCAACALPSQFDRILRSVPPGGRDYHRARVYGRRLPGERRKPAGRHPGARACQRCFPNPVGYGLLEARAEGAQGAYANPACVTVPVRHVAAAAPARAARRT